MLNWRRDPDYERRMNALESEIAQIKSEAEQLRNESEQIKSEAEQIKKEAEQIKKETELIKQDTEQLRLQNAKGRQLLASIDALSLPDATSSTQAPPTATDSAPCLP
jgi:archaellum component FlaC